MRGSALLLCLSAALCCANAESLRSQIDAMNQKVCDFIKARDVKGFKSYMKPGVTPNFKYTEAGHTMTFDQMCQEMAMGIGQMKISKIGTHIVGLKEKGNSATATVSHNMVSSMAGPDKKTHTMTYSGLSTDTYVKKGGKWKMASMTWGKQTMLMDGKPMPTGPATAK